jgi:hypothetical protein
VAPQKIYEHPLDPTLDFKPYTSGALAANSAALDPASREHVPPRVGADYKSPKPTPLKKRMPTPRTSLDWTASATLEELESRVNEMGTIVRTASADLADTVNVVGPAPSTPGWGQHGNNIYRQPGQSAGGADGAGAPRPASARLPLPGEVEVIRVGDLVQYDGIAGDKWQARILEVQPNHRFTLVQVKDGADMPWRCSAHRVEITPFPKAAPRMQGSLRGGDVPKPESTPSAIFPGLHASERGSGYLYQRLDEGTAHFDHHGPDQPWTDL